MFESRYSKFVSKSHSRFSETDEIMSDLSIVNPKKKDCASGASLYYDDKGNMMVDNTDNHSLIIGSTGSKKTRVGIVPTIQSVISSKESLIINDPKGELFNKTSGFAAAAGYTIRVLNMRFPSVSDGWNPLSKPYYEYMNKDYDHALQSLSEFITYIFLPSYKKTNDRYWIDAAQSFFTSIILLLFDSSPSEYINIETVLNFCYQENLYKLKELKKMIDQTSTAAFGLHAVLDLEAEKTVSCVYSELLSALSTFKNNSTLTKMLSRDDISFFELVKNPTIIYIHFPDEKEDKALKFLVNYFLTQSYESLVDIASGTVNGMLPRRVNFILDEFSNMPKIPAFENRISEARGKNIRYFLAIQAYSQLKSVYQENAQTIRSNCNNWVILSNKEIDFLKELAEICGTEDDFNGKEQYLISPSQMQHLKKYQDGAEALIIRAGKYPYVTKLIDYEYTNIFPVLPPFDVSKKSRKASLYSIILFDNWFEYITKEKYGFKFPFKQASNSHLKYSCDWS